jgi:hypothetical protein
LVNQMRGPQAPQQIIIADKKNKYDSTRDC